MALELRPTCEHCNKALPPASAEARICSFECTFCDECASGVLSGVCPNCGGNFVSRPIRPARNWKGGNYLGKYPASMGARFRPADLPAHHALLEQLAGLPPASR
jgi:uncharacterized protein